MRFEIYRICISGLDECGIWTVRTLSLVGTALYRDCACRAAVMIDEDAGGLNEKVTAVYKGVGLIMKRFTTGKVPKAFKIIPNLQNWEEVSYCCNLQDPMTFPSIRICLSLLTSAGA